jgi:hypothetical protein
MERENLLGGAGPADTRLPAEPEAAAALHDAQNGADGSGADGSGAAGAADGAGGGGAGRLKEVAGRFPAYSAAWAALAERAFADGDAVTAYAYARTGYHRGLDQLRRAGWRGNGPIPWSHEPNRGFLRCLYMLGQAAQAIGEQDEAARCQQFLKDSSAEAATVLGQTENLPT